MNSFAAGPSPARRLARRAALALTSGALAAGGIVGLSLTTAAPAQAATVPVSQASFVWGLNGYAQKGIFGPWSYKDITGNATQLVGGVSGGSQSEYITAPVPATSMPATTPPPQKTPNAIKFMLGSGTADPATGAMDVDWTGSYTVNAYPPEFNAPNEIYSDPQLTVAANGVGELTMNFELGAGVDIDGNPTEEEDFGRLTMMTFKAGADARTGVDSFRYTPDYQGVTVTLPDDDSSPQVADCAATGGATGWWGSWPQAFITAIPSSVRPHFYSTGCGGMNDNKPPLPADIELGLSSEEPTVQVSQTQLRAEGTREVTVVGTGFMPSAATGTRPPLANRPAGAYVLFGKFAETWRPSSVPAPPSSTRVGSSTKWAVLAADVNTIGGPEKGAVELTPEGTFTTTLTVDKAAADAATLTGVAYGIYTYAGGGATNAAYETFTPITFTPTPVAAAVPAPSVKSATSALAKVTKLPTAARPGKARLTVTSPTTGASIGTAKMTLRTAGGKVIKKVRAANLNAAGVAKFSLPRLSKGRYKIVAVYVGSTTTAASKTKVSFRVK